MRIQAELAPGSLAPALARMWELSAAKILATEAGFDPRQGAPVFTSGGRWTSRGWTEWTQGFQYGSALLQFDATGGPAVPGAGPREHRAAHGRRT